MSSAICFNLAQSKILLSGNELKPRAFIWKDTAEENILLLKLTTSFFSMSHTVFKGLLPPPIVILEFCDIGLEVYFLHVLTHYLICQF